MNRFNSPPETWTRRITDWILAIVGIGSISFFIWACFNLDPFAEAKQEPQVINKTYNITIVQCADKKESKHE